MLIRKLKLAGFKSFVEPAELRIEPGLTGVVGPNGCGKSNLLEAIRWVMGENSPKSMRSGGMDDVIFAGTAQRPPRDFAEVQRPGPEQLRLQKALQARLAEISAALGIQPEVLATRRELAALARGTRDLPVMRGWRREAVGEKLLAAL